MPDCDTAAFTLRQCAFTLRKRNAYSDNALAYSGQLFKETRIFYKLNVKECHCSAFSVVSICQKWNCSVLRASFEKVKNVRRKINSCVHYAIPTGNCTVPWYARVGDNSRWTHAENFWCRQEYRQHIHMKLSPYKNSERVVNGNAVYLSTRATYSLSWPTNVQNNQCNSHWIYPQRTLPSLNTSKKFDSSPDVGISDCVTVAIHSKSWPASAASYFPWIFRWASNAKPDFAARCSITI